MAFMKTLLLKALFWRYSSS